MLVAAGDKGEGTRGVRGQPGHGAVVARTCARARAIRGETTAAAAAQAAARASLEQAALVTAEVVPEGTGAGNRPRRGGVPRERAPGGGAGGRHRGRARRDRARLRRRRQGRRRARGSAAPSWAPTWRAGSPGRRSSGAAGAATGDLRAVTVDADVVEPAAIPELVKSLRGVGAVSAAELTRVSAGRAEIRVRTRAAPAALAAALSRAAGTMITLSDVQISGDVIRTRARLRPAAPAPAPGSNP